MENVANIISSGQAILGIELGSTRIKSVLTDPCGEVLFSGAFTWENRFENGFWTYSREEMLNGLRESYKDLSENVRRGCGVTLSAVAAIGISGMMHGYLPFDEDWNLLTPFRTWRNTVTQNASRRLGELFGFHIPQRWTIAHLGEAMLKREAHLDSLRYLTTLSGYIHKLLTGEFVIGRCEASGMFPIDEASGSYNGQMIERFCDFARREGYSVDLPSMLPAVLPAGALAGRLTEEGARLLDPSGALMAGAPVCPPEGDAGTGMVATNSVRRGSCNVSAGTSIFAMAVLERPLHGVYEELDVLASPTGSPVVMVHCNNCTGEIDGYASCFFDMARALGIDADISMIYKVLYSSALKGGDAGAVMYNYISGEHITGVENGAPMLVRAPGTTLDLNTLSRALIYSSVASLRLGMDILKEKEGMRLSSITGHGGLFKTPIVGQRITAAALRAPVTVMKTAAEGGAWGMALLALYMLKRSEGQSLEDFLDAEIFSRCEESVEEVDEQLALDFDRYIEAYRRGLDIERRAAEIF